MDIEFTPVLPTSFGNLSPGCNIVYEGNEYKLQFGWHINYSNQNIYSWYLVPVGDRIRFQTNTGYDSMSDGIESYVRTLYKEMIEKIESVRYLPD